MPNDPFDTAFGRNIGRPGRSRYDINLTDPNCHEAESRRQIGRDPLGRWSGLPELPRGSKANADVSGAW